VIIVVVNHASMYPDDNSADTFCNNYTEETEYDEITATDYLTYYIRGKYKYRKQSRRKNI